MTTDWLNEHKPPKKYSTLTYRREEPYINWSHEDVQLAEQIEVCVTNIKNLEPPARVTKQYIIRVLGRASRIKKKNDKLPLTNRTLKTLMETPADFVIRKIWYTLELYKREQKIPFRSIFMTRAGARNLAHLPEVSAAINAALQQLQASINE